VSGVHKGTVVRGESDFPSGALHITDCHDTVIYALAPLQVRIVNVVRPTSCDIPDTLACALKL
jgi:hypothetical protein